MKKIKICFLGLGSIALKHLKNLKKFSIKNSIKIELYALRQSKFNLLYDFSEFDIKYMYSYEEFKENNYDVVFITNPTNLHYVSLINTINHTKFVFLEKPSFDNSSYDFSSLEPKSNFIYVACPLRFHNLIRHAREIISSEKVFSCRIICSSYMPDWQKSRDYKDSFRSDANKGGGVDIDLI
jgi:predicted dehydrogenase